MNTLKIACVSALAVTIAACGGGDINVTPTTVDNSTDNSVDNSVTNPGNTQSAFCASYEQNGSTFTGERDGQNCLYNQAFVDLDNPLTVDVTLPNIGSGVHIFLGSLVVGENHATDAALQAAGITEGGDGPTLTIAEGSTLAFQTSDDYMVINRGSKIMAEGTANEPITITSHSDAVAGTVGPEDVSQWGGMIINGFGITNKCAYTGSVAGNDLATTDCHVAAEGKAGAGQTNYGGANNADNSGILKYFIVKHTGFAVEEGNELNGIAFNAVGSGTTVDFLQAYSTFDDGIEFFGGAVNVDHYVAVYVRDDSIDIDEGYSGTINHALVIQAEEDGNHCIESDGIGSFSKKTPEEIQGFIDSGINSRATIRNLTCIVSPNATGTHDPGAGWRIREAHYATIQNSILTTAYKADGIPADTDGNYCVRIQDRSLEAAANDEMKVQSSIVACQDLIKGDTLPGGVTQQQFLETASLNNVVYQSAEMGEDPTAATNPGLVILDGFYSVPLANMVVGGNAVSITPEGGATFIGGVLADEDWTAGWTYGLHDGRRAQALWFE